MLPAAASWTGLLLLCFVFQLNWIVVKSFMEGATSRRNSRVKPVVNHFDKGRCRYHLMMADEQSKDIGSMSIEELVTLADSEMELKLLNNQEELNQKKREIIQKKKDKLYEKYWEQRSKSTSTNGELATFNQYYGIMASNGTYSRNEDKRTIDNKIEPLSPKQNAIASVGAIAVVSAAFLTKYLFPASVSLRITSRMVKVDYPIEKLFAETKKVLLNKEILASLPAVSVNKLSSLRLLRGRLPSFSTDKVNIIMYWNPADKLSVTAVNRVGNNVSHSFSIDIPHLFHA